LSEVFSGAGVGESGSVEVLFCAEEASVHVVEAVVVGGGDNVESHPFDLVDDVWGCSGVGSSGLGCRVAVVLVVVDEHLEVCECEVCVSDDFEHLFVSGFAVD
jgi:hypothetical protein